MKIAYLLPTAAFLTGCATQTGIVPIGTDTYMVSRQGYVVTQSVVAIKADAYKEAAAFCRQEGKEFQVVNTSSAEGIPGRRLPTAEIQFMCLAKGDRELARPKLKAAPDLVIETR